MNKKYYKCNHPDHEENTSCEDRAIGCSEYCLCCMGEIAIPLDESVPFFESENVIRWKVSEGKESSISFFYQFESHYPTRGSYLQYQIRYRMVWI